MHPKASFITLKQAEIPINKFEAQSQPKIDYLKNFKRNNQRTLKFGDWDEVYKAITIGNRIVKQLTSNLEDIKTIRNNIRKCDLDRFDKMASNIKCANETICDYLEYVQEDLQTLVEDKRSPFYISRIADGDIAPIICNFDLIQTYNRCNELQKIVQDCKDIQDCFEMLHTIVVAQNDNVNEIYTKVENAKVDAEQMLSYLKSIRPKIPVLPFVRIGVAFFAVCALSLFFLGTTVFALIPIFLAGICAVLESGRLIVKYLKVKTC